MTTRTFNHKLGLCLSLAGLTAFAVACGSPSSSNDAGPGAGTDAGNNAADAGNTTDAGPADAGAPPVTYCDGFGAKDSSANLFYVGTFAFGGTLKTEGCSTALNAQTDGTSLTTISGVFDIDTSDTGAGAPVGAIFPGDCVDVGQTGYVTPTGATFTTPTDGATTVAAGYASTATAVSIYGVVTAINDWKFVSATDQDSGEIYLQDPTTAGTAPAMHSGVEVYFPKPAAATTYGTPPTVGQVVEITALKWSPYQGVNQFEAVATTVVSVIGSAALPTPVMLPATTVGAAASGLVATGYEGMRVQVTGGPFTVAGSSGSNTCPTALQYTTGG